MKHINARGEITYINVLSCSIDPAGLKGYRYAILVSDLQILSADIKVTFEYKIIPCRHRINFCRDPGIFQLQVNDLDAFAVFLAAAVEGEVGVVAPGAWGDGVAVC